jgi:hypothetical protein
VPCLTWSFSRQVRLAQDANLELLFCSIASARLCFSFLLFITTNRSQIIDRLACSNRPSRPGKGRQARTYRRVCAALSGRTIESRTPPKAFFIILSINSSVDIVIVLVRSDHPQAQRNKPQNPKSPFLRSRLDTWHASIAVDFTTQSPRYPLQSPIWRPSRPSLSAEHRKLWPPWPSQVQSQSRNTSEYHIILHTINYLKHEIDHFLHSYESLPPNFSLLQNMVAGAFAGIAVCFT